MEFKFYDPKILVPEFVRREYNDNYSVCDGCVFTGIPPEDCIHLELESNSVQSDMFCPHCTITIEESGLPFRLSQDPHLEDKLEELKTVLKMAGNPQ